MTIQELQVKYDESTKKVEKRLNLTKKVIANDRHNLDGILEDFNKLITNTKGEIVNVSLMPLNIKWFPDNPHTWTNEGEVMDNLCKLRDLMVTNFNWKVKLNKVVNEENEEKVEVIWNFLQQWRARAREWYIKEAQRLIKLTRDCEDKFDIYRTSPYFKEEVASYRYNGEYYAEENFKKEFFKRQPEFQRFVKEITKVCAHRDFITREIKSWTEKIDEELLDITLDKEVKAKYKDLINRITSVVGTITDAKLLRIGEKGDINGIIVGNNGRAKVETIGAAGYNIQIFHYRTLIHKIN